MSFSKTIFLPDSATLLLMYLYSLSRTVKVYLPMNMYFQQHQITDKRLSQKFCCQI